MQVRKHLEANKVIRSSSRSSLMEIGHTPPAPSSSEFNVTLRYFILMKNRHNKKRMKTAMCDDDFVYQSK